jgi:predicted DCC family thiol-disulfide oxidoreductase YuxK
MPAPTKLLVLYDEQCPLCRRCRSWLEAQPTHVEIEFLAAGSAVARTRFGSLPWLGADLVVVDDDGNAWVGAAAFIMCLWATEQYRVWSYRLSGKALAPLAERFFHMISANRSKIGAVVGARDCPDGRCKHRADAAEPGMAKRGSHRNSPAFAGAGYEPPITRCHACGAAIYSSATSCWSCHTAR